jgi:hypothetical protein
MMELPAFDCGLGAGQGGEFACLVGVVGRQAVSVRGLAFFGQGLAEQFMP